MNNSFRIGLGSAAFTAAFLVAVVGCTGGGSTGDGTADGGASSGSSGTSTSSSSGSSGNNIDSGSDAGACSIEPLIATRTCIPTYAKANTSFAIEVQTTSCLACGNTFAPCDVVQNGTTITINLKENHCPLPANEGCSADCIANPSTTCTIPALAAGSYSVVLGGEVRTSEDPVRTLVVSDRADATSSCKIPTGSTIAISADGVPSDCTTGNDAECVLEYQGDVCSPCFCDNVAIATSAKQSYDDELRALRGSCPDTNGQPACAACPADKVAKCVANKCTVVAN